LTRHRRRRRNGFERPVARCILCGIRMARPTCPVCSCAVMAMGTSGDKDFMFTYLGRALLAAWMQEGDIPLEAAWVELSLLIEKMKMVRRLAVDLPETWVSREYEYLEGLSIVRVGPLREVEDDVCVWT
jgi:hypothetical protein